MRLLREHRVLWVELSKFMFDMSDAIGSSVNAWYLTMVLSLAMVLFRTASNLLISHKIPIISVIHIPLITGPIILFHTAAHFTDTKVNTASPVQ